MRSCESTSIRPGKQLRVACNLVASTQDASAHELVARRHELGNPAHVALMLVLGHAAERDRTWTAVGRLEEATSRISSCCLCVGSSSFCSPNRCEPCKGPICKLARARVRGAVCNKSPGQGQNPLAAYTSALHGQQRHTCTCASKTLNSLDQTSNTPASFSSSQQLSTHRSASWQPFPLVRIHHGCRLGSSAGCCEPKRQQHTAQMRAWVRRALRCPNAPGLPQ